MSREVDPELNEALEDLRAYLSDRVAPLLVAEALELLLDHPAALSAELATWIEEQARVHEKAPSELAGFALTKIRGLEQFELLPQARFAELLARLEVDLSASLSAVGESGGEARRAGAPSPPVAAIAAAESAPADPPLTSALPVNSAAEPQLSSEEWKRLEALERQVERALAFHAESGSGEPGGELAPKLLVLAVAQATSAVDLEARFQMLRRLGAAPALIRDLIGALAAAVPDLAVRSGERVEIVRGPAYRAVRSALEQAGDEARLAERWKSLLPAAIDAFNGRATERAATLFEVLADLVRSVRIDPFLAERALTRSHEQFEVSALLAAVAHPRRRAALASFVPLLPGWRPESILEQLEHEPDRRRRRALLAIAELSGAETRQRVVERLRESMGDSGEQTDPWWYQRNLVYLLHRLPRPEGTDWRAELELARALSEPAQHPAVQREAFALLAKLPRGQGGGLLTQRLSELERRLDSGARLEHEPLEIERLLDALAAALVRSGSAGARRALVQHALVDRPRGGNAAARLEELAEVDLANDRDCVTTLLQALQSFAAVKIFGIEVANRDAKRAHVARALAATSDLEARRALVALPSAVVAVAPMRGAARDAAPKEKEFEEPSEGAVSPMSTGALSLPELVDLMVNLAELPGGARLVVGERDVESAALDLIGGRLVSVRAFGLQGAPALNVLFQTFAQGSYRLEPVASGESGELDGQPLARLIAEALRRREEYELLKGTLPDQLFVRSTGRRPTVLAGETDVEFVRTLWELAGRGATTSGCETELGGEPLRVRALLGHWLEEGVLDGKLVAQGS